jgi:hypothetical protein
MERQAVEGVQAWHDYRADFQASIDRIPELRAARLAREAAAMKREKKKRRA